MLPKKERPEDEEKRGEASKKKKIGLGQEEEKKIPQMREGTILSAKSFKHLGTMRSKNVFSRGRIIRKAIIFWLEQNLSHNRSEIERLLIEFGCRKIAIENTIKSMTKEMPNMKSASDPRKFIDKFIRERSLEMRILLISLFQTLRAFLMDGKVGRIKSENIPAHITAWLGYIKNILDIAGKPRITFSIKKEEKKEQKEVKKEQKAKKVEETAKRAYARGSSNVPRPAPQSDLRLAERSQEQGSIPAHVPADQLPIPAQSQGHNPAPANVPMLSQAQGVSPTEAYYQIPYQAPRLQHAPMVPYNLVWPVLQVVNDPYSQSISYFMSTYCRPAQNYNYNSVNPYMPHN